jgi:hypothetical protein
MKTLLFFCSMLFLLPAISSSQTSDTKNKKDKDDDDNKMGIGLKGGLNFANVSNVTSISTNTQTGYVIGAFLAPPKHGILSFRTEIDFSNQGYDFESDTTTGSVHLNYLLLPQLMNLSITKFVQLQFGMQIAYLLSAKADTSNTTAISGAEALSYYNRFDYGVAGGIEIYPIFGIFIGGRYNHSFGDMYKEPSGTTPTEPAFVPDVNVKSNVVQLYVGYKF